MKKLSLSILLLSACGAAPAPVEVAEEDEQLEPQHDAPFAREASLPAAPQVVVELEMDAVRGTLLENILRDAMDGDDPADLLGRRMLERSHAIRVGMYGDDHAIVLIGRGRLEGMIDEVVAQLSDGREPPPRVERSGFRAYVMDSELVAVQSAPDTVVMSYPQYADEVLRTASGAAPATPLPPEMRALLERPALRDAPMRMLFRAREGEASGPLDGLVREAGFAGVAARFEGGQIVATGTAQAANAASAAQLAAAIERFSRETTGDVGTPSLGDAIRNAAVRADDRWVEVTLRFPPEDFEAFMRIVGELGGF